MDNLVKIAKVPGLTKEVAVPDAGMAVSALLALAGFTETEGYSIRIDGDAGTLATIVTGGSTVILSKEVKGN